MIHQSRITAGRERSYILVLISCVCSTMIGQYGRVHGVDWDYTVHGPPTWAADFPSCGGISQSPINIEPFKTHVAQPGFLKLWSPQTLSTNIPLTNDHFSFYFDMAARNVQLTSSSFWSNMRLLNVHLHAPSEHTINGVQYPLEAHYVFVPLDYTEKVNQNVPYELTVIGVLYSSSPAATSSDVIAFAAENAASLAAPGSSRVLSWVPKIGFSDTFYTYSGSLTTPPCSEIVNWFVSTEIMPAKTSDIESITALIRQLTNTNAGNARPVQALNGRDVKVRSFYSSD